jgi:hypothetical protein
MINLIIGIAGLIASFLEFKRDRKYKLFWTGWNFIFGILNTFLGLNKLI